jgi:multiple sugar transport system permease protein
MLGRVLSYAVLTPIALLAAVPFFYIFSLSLQTDAEVLGGQGPLLPAAFDLSNYVRIWGIAPFARFILNSLVVAGSITLFHLLLDPLAGYTFAKYRFPLRDVLFLLILGTMMVPLFVRIIPLYIVVGKLGWLNTYPGLNVPFLTSANGVFLMRQFMRPLPSELIDAGRMDGASEWRIYWQLILPQVVPALVATGLFTFTYQWNELLWPLVATTSVQMRTMTVGLTLFKQEAYTQWNLVATGSVFLLVPR